MRPTTRLLAIAKYLEAGTPTGLTGLWTHGTPRSALIYLYGQTLHRLQAIPSTSVYRQSVEATTLHRLGIVEKMVPAGHEQWTEKAKKLMEITPATFQEAVGLSYRREARTVKLGDQVFVIGTKRALPDERIEEWDGEESGGRQIEDGLSAEEPRFTPEQMEEMRKFEVQGQEVWATEPQLTADQIKDLEIQIGAGLIEEVIQVAENELHLVDTMEKSKPWEDLEEKPVEGQWTYFERTSM